MAGLTEERAALIDDNYATGLPGREVAALRLTDALIGMPHRLAEDVKRDLDARFSEAEQAELAMGVGLFLGMSKVLITLGVEPENMPTTVLPTPGS